LTAKALDKLGAAGIRAGEKLKHVEKSLTNPGHILRTLAMLLVPVDADAGEQTGDGGLATGPKEMRVFAVQYL
ncbi:MAG: hypothetical protein DWQ08_00270, partial [Proteobacteria bacterium]